MQIEEQIRSLSFFEGPLEITPVSGGITNRNFFVDEQKSRYFVRVCEEAHSLGIDRRNERVCQQAAAAADISPHILHIEDGILVIEHLDARTLSPEDVGEPNVLNRLAATVRRLHDACDDLVGEMLYFCPFQTIRTYTTTARQLGAQVPQKIDKMLKELPMLSRQLSPFRPVLCHNDLLAANILDDGEKLWLVDWEYAGMGNPLFDLAGISSNCQFNDDQERQLLDAYAGTAGAPLQRELRILKTVSLLRESLWAIIQTVASQIEFDYEQYAAENLAAFEVARGNIDTH